MFFFFYNILLPIPRFLFGSIIEPFSKWQQRVNEQPIMFQLEVPYLLQPKWRPCVVYIDLLQVGALAAMFQCIMHIVMDFVSIAAIHLILINIILRLMEYHYKCNSMRCFEFSRNQFIFQIICSLPFIDKLTPLIWHNSRFQWSIQSIKW